MVVVGRSRLIVRTDGGGGYAEEVNPISICKGVVRERRALAIKADARGEAVAAGNWQGAGAAVAVLLLADLLL